jgi:hypothetical protein
LPGAVTVGGVGTILGANPTLGTRTRGDTPHFNEHPKFWDGRSCK